MTHRGLSEPNHGCKIARAWERESSQIEHFNDHFLADNYRYITLSDRDLSMFPRSDGILLGGTFERGDSSLDVTEEDKRRVVEGHIGFFRRMRMQPPFVLPDGEERRLSG